MKAPKCGRQREPVKACLMNRHDHPTADALYVSICEEFPNISLGTVYRNLNLLTEIGGIRKLTCGDDAIHFDEDIHQHHHLVYSECNQVYDMELGAMEDPNKEAQEHAPSIIDSHYVLFYGRCSSCLQKRVDKVIDKLAQMICIDISNNYYH